MAVRSTSSRVALKVISTILKILLNILFYSIVIVLLVKISGVAHDFGYQVFGKVTASEAPGHDTTIEIDKGESTMNIASKLELNGVIVNKYSFFLKAKLKKYNLMPGTYNLNTSMTYDEIFSILTVPSADDSQDKKNTKDTGGKSSAGTKDSGTKDSTTKDSTSGDQGAGQ
ncbi:endolytic transglycosylase MltG [Anaerocolumna chitinilytica]|uniref:Uncharacterized protein n=1 Tax=Anaerocolumna chitinilytica TaxID=1727145 RepID=A0A7I8DNR3_9FIRM|nr:endolytic transglycosylase MltG [Anaerocolumna chitinilytica]BCK00020.1 hypothetical protein bsdcttw_30600 [Anaerocolumna chitinilytica]